MGTPLRTWFAAAALVAATAGPAAGQRIDPDRVFAVTVEVNGRMINSMVREGSYLRLVLRETEEYHFSPVLRDGREDRVLVAVSRGTAGEPETLRVVERVELSTGVPAALRSAPSLRIVIDGIRRANRAETAAAAPAGRTASGAFSFASTAQEGGCCVCCEGACACACGVSFWCGHCCTKGCCDPMLPTGNDRTPALTGTARFASFSGGTCARGSLFDRARTPTPAPVARTALR